MGTRPLAGLGGTGVDREGGGSQAKGQGLEDTGQLFLCHHIQVQNVTMSEIYKFELGL